MICLDERLGLLDELRAARCTVSILTTYSIDFQFYETVVLRKLNRVGVISPLEPVSIMQFTIQSDGAWMVKDGRPYR